MIRHLSRTQAWILLALFAAALAWSAALSPAVPEPGNESGSYSDIQLYHDVAARVATGESYYAAATALHRQHGFPTIPFVTVRLPTLAYMAAHLGWRTLQAILAAMLCGTALLWYVLSESRAGSAERLGMAAALLIAGAMVTQAGLVAQHELWAGILLCAALALRGGRHWPWAIALTAMALTLREMALPFALLALAFAIFHKRRRETLAWIAVITLFMLGLWLHAMAVNGQVRTGDLASAGWHALRGPAAFVQDIVDVTLLNRLPLPLAYPLVLLALPGWLAAPFRQSCFALLYFLGYCLMLALFARGQNFYWALLLLPSWFIGYAYVPRAAKDLFTVLAGRTSGL